MNANELGGACDEFKLRLRSDADYRVEDFLAHYELQLSDHSILELLRIEAEMLGECAPLPTLREYTDLLNDFAHTIGDDATPSIPSVLEGVVNPEEYRALRVALLRIKRSRALAGEVGSTLAHDLHRDNIADAVSNETNSPSHTDTDRDDRPRPAVRAGNQAESSTRREPVSLPARYRLIRQLGEGGFGSVVLAHDTVLKRDVAIKLPKPDVFLSQDAKSAFLHEARTCAQMHHPGLVTVHDIDTSEDMLCIVQEFIDGCDLRAWINNDSISREAALRLMIDVAEAVDFAHETGFVHRDLKPSNILVDHQGKPHVADFGLALHSSDAKARSVSIAGTPAYMSPEQIQGYSLDRGSDIWSLGVILFELLTSVRPFLGNSLNELTDRVLREEPRKPSKLDPRISRRLDEVCLRCFERRPANRFASAGDLAQSLKTALDSSFLPEGVAAPQDDSDVLEQQILRYVNAPDFEPCKVRTLAVTLGMDSQDEKKRLRTVLQSLASRSLLRFGSDRLVRTVEAWYIEGRLASLHGNDWSLEEMQSPATRKPGLADGVTIDWTHIGGSKQGDHVRVRLFEQDTPGSIQGEVAEIIHESPIRFRGRVEVSGGEAWVMSDVDRLPLGPACLVPARHGDAVFADRLAGAKNIAAVVSGIEAERSEQEHIKVVTSDLDVPHRWPDPDEIDQNLCQMVGDVSDGRVLDLREHPTYSIAADGRGDIANAFTIVRLRNRRRLLGVHVTDVTSEIDSGANLDEKLARRGASLLLGRFELPLLPTVLSHCWLSLRPDEDRRCKTVWMEFAPDGECIKTEICRSLIRREHLPCGVADSLLVSANAGEVEGSKAFLADAVELANLLRKKRHDPGQFELYRPPLSIGLLDMHCARDCEN